MRRHSPSFDTGMPHTGQPGRLVCHLGLPLAHASHKPDAVRGSAGAVTSAAELGVHVIAAGHQLAQRAAQCMGTSCAAN